MSEYETIYHKKINYQELVMQIEGADDRSISRQLSSEEIRNSLQSIEAEKAKLETALQPLLIMLTDLKNSTVYYDRLGDIAAKSVIFAHNQLLFPVIEQYHGNIVKTIGDGILATFESVPDGITASMEMQKTLQAYNLGKEPESVIAVRIGLHYGKTLVFENDVFGDSINTAARIEALADSDLIYISRAVVDVANLSDDELFYIGHIALKGKLEPVEIFGIVWEQSNQELLSLYQEKRLAFEQIKHDESQAHIKIGGKISVREDESVEMIAQNNPFFYRTAITQPDFFFGRETLLHKIFSRLTAPRPQSISLYGERRIGKSSLLWQIQSTKLRKQFNQDVEKQIFIYLDIQSMRSATVEHFIERLFVAVRDTFMGQIEFDLPYNYHGFTTLVKELTKAEIKIYILFDEFDIITLNKNFTEEFYSWLRSLASHYPVAFITSSLSQLQNLCATKQISDSPFFNIFTAFQVSPFTRAEAENMISSLLRLSKSGYDFSGWYEEIFSQAGFLPFFIQIYCANLYDLFPHNPTPAEVYEAYLEEAREHFEHIIRNLTPEEVFCLKGMITGKKIGKVLEINCQTLIRKGYLLENKGNLVLFSQAFARHFTQKIMANQNLSIWARLWNKVS